MRIDDATDDDLPAVVAIYNDVLRTSTAIYRDEPATLDERRAWNEARKKNGYPLLVARTDAVAVAGFATFGDFRPWPGYRFTIEHSVHVAEGLRGHGIGTALMEALIARGTALGKHVMVAGIDSAKTRGTIYLITGIVSGLGLVLLAFTTTLWVATIAAASTAVATPSSGLRRPIRSVAAPRKGAVIAIVAPDIVCQPAMMDCPRTGSPMTTFETYGVNT